MSSAISQLSCFSAVVDSRRSQLHQRSRLCLTQFRPGKVLNVMNGDGHGSKLSQLENKTPSYVEDASASYNGSSVQPHSAADSFVAGGATNEQESVVSQPKRAAMIHDFCFGIPFGGLVFSGGLVGFLVSKNPRTLMSGVLYGGALLALSTLSLKVWKQGKPSFPFILGQAVLSLALLFKHSRAYTLTNKLFPTAFNVVISAAMLCFYAYVMISGGNPPPKKLKPTAAVESS
ncbi:protein FATTY ACID EXPORT 1, chloroplastic-like [Salvia miltiorrhiza]|uniref:protein FATTY ACID EXPORT 1, chloroplastic-like n=1 Tax=Salvia miltiorrhiza TaxID=226208 RepID=UPI0025ABD2F1|nr:protein FATTY ACID EXPORT 1, chloroplastic-like [Salvia miltiorrhiza]XP_057770380.1 protein FATTY ACID EXPORT 1, chloroplastic-like [Salvia miltiorrhiza]